MVNKEQRRDHHFSENVENVTLEKIKENAFQVCYNENERITNLSQKQFFGGLNLFFSSKAI